MLAGVLALPVILYVRVRIAEAAWARSFGPLESLPDRFHGERNETTEMFPEWTAGLGLTSNGRDGLIPIHPPPPEVVTAVREYGWYGWQSASASSTPAAPTAAVEQYVLSRAGVFNGIAEWMDVHPPPSWPVILREFPGPPNFLPNLQLQKVILAAALVREWRGDHREGERLLATSWKLNESLRERPELIAQLLALAIFRMQCIAIRKMAVDPLVWQKRLAEHDYRASVVTAHQVETYRRMREVKTNIYADPTYIAGMRALNASYGGGLIGFGDRPRWRVLLTTPLRWFDLPALLEGSRQLVLAAQNAPIDETLDLSAAYERGFSKWFYIPEPDVPPQNFATAFTRVDRAVAEEELTAKILVARAARAANGGRWPKSIDGFEASRIANGQWIYEVSPRGVTIRFSREVPWPKTPLGGSVPLRYTSSSGS